MRVHLSPRAEEVLSYLQGLAPVGQTIEPDIDALMGDLGFSNRTAVYGPLNALIRNGFIRRVASGMNSAGVFEVLRRLGATGKRPKPAPEPMERIKLWPVEYPSPDAKARLAEIPPDPRGLTARLLGDPIPGDPRRPWQGDRSHG